MQMLYGKDDDSKLYIFVSPGDFNFVPDFLSNLSFNVLRLYYGMGSVLL